MGLANRKRPSGPAIEVDLSRRALSTVLYFGKCRHLQCASKIDANALECIGSAIR